MFGAGIALTFPDQLTRSHTSLLAALAHGWQEKTGAVLRLRPFSSSAFA
jgi:hypothetical protein